MFVCMDVGIVAGAHPSISHRHALHDDSIPHGSKKRPAAVKKVRLSPVKKQMLVEGTARTRSGAFSYHGGEQKGAPYIYNKVEWGGCGVRCGCRPLFVDAARG